MKPAFGSSLGKRDRPAFPPHPPAQTITTPGQATGQPTQHHPGRQPWRNPWRRRSAWVLTPAIAWATLAPSWALSPSPNPFIPADAPIQPSPLAQTPPPVDPSVIFDPPPESAPNPAPNPVPNLAPDRPSDPPPVSPWDPLPPPPLNLPRSSGANLPTLPPFFNPPAINDPDAALREELERRLANDPNPWRAYRLAPLDSIGIQVAGFSDLSTAASVDPEGRILVPLLGRLLVEGLTLQEVEDLLRVGFDRYVIDPDVTVVLNSQINPDVTISGEVVKPGFYRLSAYDTVSGALRTAGGVTGYADLRTVRLRRLLPDGTIAEKTFDLIGAIIAGNPEQAVVIQDGDTVIVPRRDPSNAPNYDMALAARINLAQPTIRIRLLSYAAGGMTTLNLPNGSTFVDAISGTPLDTARLSQMALIRFDPEQGRAVSMTLNGKEAFLGDPTQNPQLQDNDVIVVNRNLVARITYALNTFTQPFRDVLGFLLFFDEIQGAGESLFGPGAIFGTEEEETTGGSSSQNSN